MYPGLQLLLPLTFALVLSACASGTHIQQPASPIATGAPATWVLETLDGQPAPTGAGGNPVQLVLNPAQQSVAGFSGCNRYAGSFTTAGTVSQGTPVSFQQLVSTRRACVDGGTLERSYLQMLGEVDAWRIREGVLELLAGERVVATFREP